MGFIHEERLSDSPYVETITRGWTEGQGSSIRPAESHWHLVFVKYQRSFQSFVVGPLTNAGVVSYTEGVEILWVKFKLGAFMPHLPTREFQDQEIALPKAASGSFWLKGSAWQFPVGEDVDTLVDRLVREEVLAYDPVVNTVLEGRQHELSARTVRHRFLRATGLTYSHIHQIERAQRAAALLQQGFSILDTVFELGYYDQPHLTRSLKQWTGHTPAQIARMDQLV